MQWLIDIIAAKVIATIGIPPCFIDRGDPAGRDMTEADFIKNDTWQPIGLGAIVPAGATAVLLRLQLAATSTNRYIKIRTRGNSNEINVSSLFNEVAYVEVEGDYVVPLTFTRDIEYKVRTGTYLGLALTVKGWWL